MVFVRKECSNCSFLCDVYNILLCDHDKSLMVSIGLFLVSQNLFYSKIISSLNNNIPQSWPCDILWSIPWTCAHVFLLETLILVHFRFILLRLIWFKTAIVFAAIRRRRFGSIEKAGIENSCVCDIKNNEFFVSPINQVQMCMFRRISGQISSVFACFIKSVISVGMCDIGEGILLNYSFRYYSDIAKPSFI